MLVALFSFNFKLNDVDIINNKTDRFSNNKWSHLYRNKAYSLS